MLRYAITDRHLLGTTDGEQRAGLIALAETCSRSGVDYLQLREKDLPETDRVNLARAMHAAIRATGGPTLLLLSGTASLAQWAGVDGAHFPSSQLSQGVLPDHGLLISASCHTLDEVHRAGEFANLILFGPVFEKVASGEAVADGVGIELLRAACTAADEVPVLALGGVTEGNAAQCVDAGAAGVAGIRLFL